MATNDPTMVMAIETELARAFDLVSEISERIDDEVLCLDEMDLRFDLLVAEAEGEVIAIESSPRNRTHQVRMRRLRPTSTSL